MYMNSCTKWKKAEVNGWYIINEKVKHEFLNLKAHITCCCLSHISPGYGNVGNAGNPGNVCNAGNPSKDDNAGIVSN